MPALKLLKETSENICQSKAFVLELCMQGIGAYTYGPIGIHSACLGSDTENQPNQKFPADVTLQNAANLTLDELQVSLAPSELMLLNTAESPAARTSISFPIEYYWFGTSAEEKD